MKKLEEVTYTHDEHKFMNKYYSSIDDDTFYDRKFSHTRSKLDKIKDNSIQNNFEDYLMKFGYYCKMNKTLNHDNRISIFFEMIDYFCDKNNTEFIESNNFVRTVFLSYKRYF